MNLRLARGLAPLAALVSIGLVACIGEDYGPIAPVEATPDGSGPTDPGAGSAPGDPGAPLAPGAPGGGDASSDAPQIDASLDAPGQAADAGQDAAPEASVDAGPPTPTCTVEAFAPTVFNFRCSANAPTIAAAGGTIAVGSYRLTRWWENGGCAGGTYRIGSMTVFDEGGARYMRFVRNHKAAAGDVGTTFTGTLLVQATAATGAVTRTERCDAATKGAVTTGQYQYAANGADPDTITFVFPNHAEVWERLP